MAGLFYLQSLSRSHSLLRHTRCHANGTSVYSGGGLLGNLVAFKSRNGEIMRYRNSATVTLNVHTTSTTTFATVAETAVSLFFGFSVILIINANLLELSHDYYLLFGL